ncbi:hypothetical protein EYF80_066056 [Liparis tanakae]|uniref:Uncharacterized protein n=1 Tax=Liparis tanakae TaxID=230148 RepID=A0A4Z2E653_9TELE|nr:hypothetical protein EYF80_066056 [Liparis tanakae]
MEPCQQVFPAILERFCLCVFELPCVRQAVAAGPERLGTSVLVVVGMEGGFLRPPKEVKRAAVAGRTPTRATGRNS